MSQAKVTEFFSTRKRNRFNQDDVLLNKSGKSHTLADSPHLAELEPEMKATLKAKLIANQDRMLRSRSTKQPPSTPTTPSQTSEQQPVSAEPLKKTRSSKTTKQPQQQQPTEQAPHQNDKQSSESGEKPTVALEEVKADVAPVDKPAKAKVNTKRRVNMAELKQKIQEFNKNLASLQTSEQETKVSEEATSAAAKSKETADAATQLPAYLKFNELASEEADPSSHLPLPKSFEQLLDTFKGSDTIVKFTHNRNEPCTFLKLRSGIQNITKHTFTLGHLGQMKTVYPEAYVFKYEKLFVDFKNGFHLIIAPNLDEIETNADNGQKQFTPGVLLKRLGKFRLNLLSMVRQCHQSFLESVGLKDVSADKIKRWHPKFDLEHLAPVESAELPLPPTDDSIKCKTGQELLSIAKEIYSSRLMKAIEETKNSLDAALDKENIAKPDTPLATPPAIVKTEPNVASTLPAPAQPKLSQDQLAEQKLKEKKDAKYSALLEKIRNKEKQKAFESMVVNSDKEKQLARMASVKETVRFLVHFFQGEKKSTLELDKVCAKLAPNLKSSILDELECKELIRSISGDEDTVFVNASGKKWLNIIKVRTVFYLQMDKTFEFNDLIAACDKEIDKVKL